MRLGLEVLVLLLHCLQSLLEVCKPAIILFNNFILHPLDKFLVAQLFACMFIDLTHLPFNLLILSLSNLFKVILRMSLLVVGN